VEFDWQFQTKSFSIVFQGTNLWVEFIDEYFTVSLREFKLLEDSSIFLLSIVDSSVKTSET